jgi:spore coat polysaccharide biosynthesis predicted glycosyltransferase SpsG
MAIDDLGTRRHDCDVLLDQNYAADGVRRYADLVPETCRVLAGPRYALLRPEYAAYRRTASPRNGVVTRVLVFFGGTDSANVTGLTMEVLSGAEFRHLDAEIVIGVNNPHRETLREQAAERPRTTLHGFREHLADVIARADLAIGAGGVTMWERMCLGLPAVVISMADNQTPASEALGQAQVIHYVGGARSVGADCLAEALRHVCARPETLVAMSRRGLETVDGLGTERLVEVLSPSGLGDLRARVLPTTADSVTIEAAGLPVAQVDLHETEDEARLEYTLDAIVRDRNWDARAIELARELMSARQPVHLRADGSPSRKYVRLGSPQEGHAALSIGILSDRTSWMHEPIETLMLGWLRDGHRVLWVHDHVDLRPGDVCFYLSYGRPVPAEARARFRHNLVVHASALPQGRGWSPLTWQILDGEDRIPVTLFDAAEQVDSGPIYLTNWLEFEGHELLGELQGALAGATLDLCRRFIEAYPQIVGRAREQQGPSTTYPRRRPEDSRLDSERTIEAQFDRFRVADNERYPAFVECRGHRYQLLVRKAGKA